MTMLLSRLCFRIPNLLVKCRSLQPYIVTIPTSNSGITILLSYIYWHNIHNIHNIQVELMAEIFLLYVLLYIRILPLTLLIRQGLHGDDQPLGRANVNFHQTRITWWSLGSLPLHQSWKRISGVFNQNWSSCWLSQYVLIDIYSF